MQNNLQIRGVTVLILSYERSEYLKRTLSFLHEHKISTIVVDGSQKPIDTTKSIMFDTISYLHFPGCDYITRLKVGADAVETDYVILLQDDGFIDPSGLDVAVRTLEADEALAAIIGGELSLRVVGAQAAYWIDERESESATKDYSGDVIERMTEYFQVWYPRLLYSCMRTKALRSATQTLPSRSLYSLDFELLLEPHVELMVLLYGRVLKIPNILTYRSFENKAVRHSGDPLVRMGELSAFEWIDDDKYNHEVGHYLGSIFDGRKEVCFNERSKFFDILKSWAVDRNGEHTFTRSRLNSLISVISSLGITGRCLSFRPVKRALNSIFKRKLFSICFSGDEVVRYSCPDKAESNVICVSRCISEFVKNRERAMGR